VSPTLLAVLPLLLGSSPAAAEAGADSLHWLDRPIARVEILGLRRTRPAVVRRELSCVEGDRLDWAKLEWDRLRLLDLDLFARLEISAQRDSILERPVLRVIAQERPTGFLLPNLEYDEEDGLTYGAFGAELNLGGRGWRAGFSGGWGGRRYVSVSAGAPWIAGRRLAATAAFTRSRERNRGEAQREDRLGASLTLAPTRGPRWSFPMSLGGEEVRAVPDPPDTARGARTDDHRWVGAGVRRDTRGSPARAVRGSLASLRAWGHGGILGGSTSFVRYECDLLRLFPTGERSALTLAARWTGSHGPVPPFLRLGLGGPSSLRGHEPGEHRGTSRWIAWTEERFPLLARREFALPSGRHVFDVTVDGAVFLDAGSVWERDQLRRGRARVRWGGGGGLRVLLPFVSILQCDAATDGRRVLVQVLTGLRM
jgi:outer membrane protein assembly factor BamA